MSNDNINTAADSRFSIMLDPGSLLSEAEALDVPQTRGKVVLEHTSGALRELKKNLSLVLDAKAAAHADVNQTEVRQLQRHLRDRTTPMPSSAVSGPNGLEIPIPPARATELNKAIEDANARAGHHFDRQMKVATETRDLIDEAVRTAITDPRAGNAVAIAQAQETRALLRGMTPSERTSLLAKQIKAGDVATVHAVLSSPAFLSGMSPEEHAALRTRAELALAPNETRQRDAANRAVLKAQDASAIFLAEIQRARVYVAPNKRDDALARLRKGGA